MGHLEGEGDWILWPPIEPEPVIAVLPLRGSELGPDSEHLRTAIPEGIHVPLARIPQLVVSAWPTVNRLAEDGLDDDEIVAALNAANSLRGSVELRGDRLLMTVRLVHTDSGRTIWQDSFDGTTAEIFEFQYEAIAAVVEKLQHRREVGGRERPACPSCDYVHFRNPGVGVAALLEYPEGRVLTME